MIEIISDLPSNTLGARCKGHVTRKDYENVLIPAVEAALKRNKKLRIYYEVAADFTAIDPGAVLEDIGTGMKHLAQWEKIAIVTDVDWIKHTAGAFAFLLHGNVKTFPLADAQEARDWLAKG
jgi:SpoIIAA-like